MAKRWPSNSLVYIIRGGIKKFLKLPKSKGAKHFIFIFNSKDISKLFFWSIIKSQIYDLSYIFGLWTVNKIKKSEECVTLHSDFEEMSYELNIKMKCLAPLLLGDFKNCLIPPRMLLKLRSSVLNNLFMNVSFFVWYTLYVCSHCFVRCALLYLSLYSTQLAALIGSKCSDVSLKDLEWEMVHYNHHSVKPFVFSAINNTSIF